MFEELQNHDKFISDAEDEARGYDTRYEKAAQAAELAAQSAHEAHTELQAARDSKVDVKAKFDKDRQTAGDAQVSFWWNIWIFHYLTNATDGTKRNSAAGQDGK